MSLVQMTLSGGAFILFIVVVRALALHRLPKGAFLALWEMAALRLLLPFTIPLPFSADTPMGRLLAAGERLSAGGTTGLEPEDVGISGVSAEAGTASGAALPVVWLVVAALMAAWFAAAYVRARQRFRWSTPDDAPAVRRWLAGQKLRRPLEVRQSVQVSSPLTYGVLRPVILLPADMERGDENALAYILTHELIHIRRFDGAAKAVFAAVLCVHWFNPLVWVMYVLANRDLELSCDERVMDALGGREKASYALTLINMEEARSRCFSPYNHFSKLAIEERIEAIMKYKKASVLALILAIVLVVGATTAFATSPEVEEGKADGTIVLAPTGFGRAADSKKADASKVNTATIQAGEENMFGKVTTENDKKADDAEAGSAAGILTGKPSSKVSIAAGSTISYTFGSGPDKTYYEKGTEIEVVIQCVYKDIPLEVSLIRKGDSEAVESHKVEGSKQTTLCFTVPADGEYYIWVKNCSLSRTQEYSSVLSR